MCGDETGKLCGTQFVGSKQLRDCCGGDVARDFMKKQFVEQQCWPRDYK